MVPNQTLRRLASQATEMMLLPGRPARASKISNWRLASWLTPWLVPNQRLFSASRNANQTGTPTRPSRLSYRWIGTPAAQRSRALVEPAQTLPSVSRTRLISRSPAVPGQGPSTADRPAGSR